MEQEKLYGGVVIKVIAILDFLRDSTIPPTSTEIAKEIKVTKGTASKIMNTMTQLRLATKDNATQGYTIGVRLIGYGEKAIESFSFEKELHSSIEKIHDEIGETIHVGVEQSGEIVYILKREAKDAVTLKSRVGDKLRMYASAMGKAILAEKTKRSVQQYFRETAIEQLTPHTITEESAFLEELAEIRRSGVSFDREENEQGIFCIGVSLTRRGHIYGAVSVSVPTYRLDEEKKERIVTVLLEMKKEVQEKL
ncbi:transcriptional regulator, IclR family [Pilibacter termitis]|uniref:Transcriptional regulator, IclR family n=1 Tax=Pilibacter termitis TaxID=263852 RepID=A0A1T4LY28_9ENTE|nr:IclR family transcriptional regulator [Pilibacter termitis]SJZ59630.1 transcriptional regulator, IclR family [Pilibacter termitis]